MHFDRSLLKRFKVSDTVLYVEVLEVVELAAADAEKVDELAQVVVVQLFAGVVVGFPL